MRVPGRTRPRLLRRPRVRWLRASGQFGWLRALGMRVPGRSCRSERWPEAWTKQRASQHIGASGRDHGRHDQRQHEIEPTLGERPVIDLNGSLEPGHVNLETAVWFWREGENRAFSRA